MKPTSPLVSPPIPVLHVNSPTALSSRDGPELLAARLSAIAIYSGFAATGVGMALPGSVLPTLLAQWSLADSQAGLLFFLAWLGSSAGALLVQAPSSRSLAIGALITAIATFGIAFAPAITHWTCFAWMALFGLGLGITMTSTSLLRCTRNPQQRGMELNRLNLVWSIGACVCPSLAAHSLRIASVRTIFCGMGVFFVLLWLWMMTAERTSSGNRLREVELPEGRDSQPTGNKSGVFWLWPISLTVMIFLPTGIESSMGGWIAAYVQRTQHVIATTVTAGTCFWIGLLLSRTFSATVLHWRHAETTVFRLSLGLVVLGTTLLIAVQSSAAILAGSFFVGFGLGPVYPLLLAAALQYSSNSRIFFIAGLGSASLPWMTGIVSSAAASLRIGLVVPLAASLLMLTLGLRLRTQAWAGQPE